MDTLRNVVLVVLFVAFLVAVFKGSRPPQPGIMRPRHTLAVVFGVLLTLIGLAVSVVVCLSVWSLAHGWPLLLISIPVLLIGLALLHFASRRKNAIGERL